MFGENTPVPLLVHVPEPVDEIPDKEIVELLEHTVGDEPAVTVAGCDTVTEMVLVWPGHPATVANTEYTPLAMVCVFAILGFCEVDVKLFGPLQL